MSDLINNSAERKTKLKRLILRLHSGDNQNAVREELIETLGQIPYGEVVEVEQELIGEGLPETEVLKLCDAHSAVLQGNVDLSGSKNIPDGHPVDIMIRENRELKKITAQVWEMLRGKEDISDNLLKTKVLKLLGLFNSLFDVDKHYQRKEYLLFPFLEKQGITGPPKVMWGKHDEIRDLIKGSIEVLRTESLTSEELAASADLILKPAIKAVEDMTQKEEEILLPMALDKLTEVDWIEISCQSLDIGFCLYDPAVEWKPVSENKADSRSVMKSGDRINLPSGSFSPDELLSVLNTLPADITFVDKNDKVKYFSQNAERIFQRNRAVLNRDVRHCHPPASSHIVDKIIEDFKSGRQNRAPFWINMGGKFIHIEYFALRNPAGEYLGTLEVSQDMTGYRSLQGEQRILSYK